MGPNIRIFQETAQPVLILIKERALQRANLHSAQVELNPNMYTYLVLIQKSIQNVVFTKY